jgi:hypothetical protein
MEALLTRKNQLPKKQREKPLPSQPPNQLPPKSEKIFDE